jgi:hypothetical protein
VSQQNDINTGNAAAFICAVFGLAIGYGCYEINVPIGFSIAIGLVVFMGTLSVIAYILICAEPKE